MSDEKLIIYHNPRCSKSRETLQILRDNNRQPEIIEYLHQPPNKQELTKIIKMLGISPRQLLRATEPEYEAAGLDDESISDEQIIEAICKNPPLLQRPIVVHGNKAIIGRPPTKVLDIV
ncbi:MAG: arsenate reductase (glutaredoxin) [Gammaproteobacteria bacterium]